MKAVTTKTQAAASNSSNGVRLAFFSSSVLFIGGGAAGPVRLMCGALGARVRATASVAPLIGPRGIRFAASAR
jgi:hypothetical protein